MIHLTLNTRQSEILLRAMAEEMRFQRHIENHMKSGDVTEIELVEELYEMIKEASGK